MKTEKEIINKLVEGLEENKCKTIETYNDIINAIISSKTVEEVMHFKQKLLMDLVFNLPINSKECYFCIKYVNKTGKCTECNYGKIHGICEEKNSDFDKIKEIRLSLYKELDFYFKDEEVYQEPIISKFEVGEKYVIRSKNWIEDEIYNGEVVKITTLNDSNYITFYFKKINLTASYYETDLIIYEQKEELK
jgi:hypothetical protein